MALRGTPGLTRALRASGSIKAKRIVAWTSNGRAAQAAAAGDALIGVTEMGAGDGQTVDVTVEGVPAVEFGGAVAYGDPITADSEGRAVKAAPASGNTARVIGHAWLDGVAGDVGEIHLAPHQITG